MSNRLEVALGSVLERIKPQIDYYALYPCTMKAQNADLSLELVPDQPRVPPHSKVKIRTGVPDMKVKVAANARVLLGFEEGNPGRPYAALWESASVTELVLNGTTIKLVGTTVTLDATAINLGANPIDAALKGTTYRLAETTLVTALQVSQTAVAAALTAIAAAIGSVATVTSLGPAAAIAATAGAVGATAGAAASTAFSAGAASYLSQVVKVK